MDRIMALCAGLGKSQQAPASDEATRGGPLNSSVDRDLPGVSAALPANFRLLC